MKTLYYSIQSLFLPELSYYLTKTIFQNGVVSTNKRISHASAMRLMQYAFLTGKVLNWEGNIFTFAVDEPEETSEENDRIDEILEDLPFIGSGPYSDEQMSLVFAYFGVDENEPETEG